MYTLVTPPTYRRQCEDRYGSILSEFNIRSPPGRLKEVWAHTTNEQRSSVLAQVTAI